MAQSADELVAQNLAARGGAAALDAIESVKFDGMVIFPGDFQLTYEEVRTKAGDVRVDMALQGLTLVQGWDGKTGWRINPFEGRKDAERMSDDEARSMADTGSIRGPLQKAAMQGSTVTYLGREDFDGTNTYKLKVTEKDGDEFVYLLDPDTMLEVKMVETRRIRGALQVFEYEFGDYEKIAGVYFPMSVESWLAGQGNNRQRTIIASGTANVPAPASLFAQPASPATAPKGN
ncbi:MAG: hypothetical protein Q27BB25_03990 [Blastomonas sp. CACIA14H2]|uniref:hypothetical protein n=1 Tax=Blastomonas sp. CACIA14H2 TaxID=1419876 RepID=UPI0003D04C1B|nr:MAG: hypothetical protein Q27BB25_03990 [Blastomonas sp. CACIA14H2]